LFKFKNSKKNNSSEISERKTPVLRIENWDRLAVKQEAPGGVEKIPEIDLATQCRFPTGTPKIPRLPEKKTFDVNAPGLRIRIDLNPDPDPKRAGKE
jgi:hypothetical protein